MSLSGPQDFNLSQPSHLVLHGSTFKASEPILFGEHFWSQLEESKDDVSCLLRRVFDPLLSDRRADADAFIPPETTITYVESLQQLVVEECSAVIFPLLLLCLLYCSWKGYFANVL